MHLTVREALQLFDWLTEEETEVMDALFDQSQSAGYQGDI